jgi:rhamnosyltransferase
VGIDQAIKNDYEHVILFDQDSFASEGMVERLLSEEQLLILNGFKVGAVGPAFIDEKTGEYAKVIRHKHIFANRVTIDSHSIVPIEADYVIASGSLIRTSVLKEIGNMKQELFIDWVDIEWGLRASHFGYKHFVIPTALMFHSIGDGFVSLGMRKVNLHSDIRNYHIVRNACHLALNPIMDIKFRINIFFKIPAYVLFYSINSKNPFVSLKLLLKACFDGFSGRLGKVF